ncbi:MAG TPA: DUF938 domain-containing protein [Polyangia bacterium]
MSARRHAPATTRNREPILEVLRRVLPARGTVLEIASGSGEHAVFFAAALPGLIWQPTDVDPLALDSIAAWTDESGATNVAPPLHLDVAAETWSVERADAIFSANLVHISPWAACLGLVAGAGRCLPSGAPLVMYGPYRIGGVHTSDSNAAFDADLRARDPRWGVRDLEAIIEAAAARDLDFVERVAMPANNQTLVFRRR